MGKTHMVGLEQKVCCSKEYEKQQTLGREEVGDANTVSVTLKVCKEIPVKKAGTRTTWLHVKEGAAH